MTGIDTTTRSGSATKYNTTTRSGSATKYNTTSRSGSATKYKYRWVWVLVACVLTLGVLVVSHVPQEAARELQTGVSDKILHAAAYFVLTWCWLKAFSSCWGGGGSKWLMFGIILVPIAIGTVIEFTQPLVGRTCSLLDWVANVVGVGVAVAVLLWMSRKRR